MYRSDKQFMKNPATAPARIYIGNIAETVLAPDLEQKFGTHGKIVGLILQRGFGFIQYENSDQAQTALHNEHGSLFFGRKLNVRQAVDKTRSNNAPQSTPNPTFQVKPSNVAPPAAVTPKPMIGVQAPPQKLPSPKTLDVPPEEEMETNAKDGGFVDATGNNENMDKENDHLMTTDNGDRRRHDNRRGNHINRSRDRDRHRDHGRYTQDDFKMRDGPPASRDNRDLPHRDMPPREMPLRFSPPRDMGSRDIPPRDMPHRDMPLRDMPPRDIPPRDMPPRDMPLRDKPQRDMAPRDLPPRDIAPYYGRGPAAGFVPAPVTDRPDRNDCEIIVVSKLLTEYAEYIEKRLKGVGLVVDLLFPNEDVPLGKVLANISSRGCLYAILIMPQNEEYRSLTLSILHGIPQEHRNMPIDDALTLITRNFDSYMRGDKSATGGLSGSPSLTDRHPEAMQMIFNLLAENRQITTGQYDRLVRYLQDRRELQSQYEITEGGGDTRTETEPNSKQAELQSRIMNILNKSADEPPKPLEVPVPVSAAPTPLLNDPSVQKALDSLLLGDMFKTISSGF